MKKDLGAIPAVYPMPVLMVATYDENGVVDVMNAAWGMICDMDKNGGHGEGIRLFRDRQRQQDGR